MRVLFIVPYPIDRAPSQRLKFEQYFKYFEKAGIKCVVRPFMTEAFYDMVYQEGRYGEKIFYTLVGYMKRILSLADALNCDLIYLHLETAPFGPPIFEYLFKLIGKPVIYDIDDIVFIPNYSPANRIIRYLDDPAKTFRILKMSSHVIVVTKYLKECALKYNKSVTFIPPTIDTDKYYVKGPRHIEGRVCVGWSGSRTTSAYLKLIENVLRAISKKYDIDIKVIGNADFSIPGLANLRSQNWKAGSEVEDLQEIDIGLYPLPKTEWVMGKGGLKALQYMGLGIPVVSSRIGACLEFIRDDANGFLADSDEEWVEKISLLIEDADLRRRIGLEGRKTVEERFSVKANASKYIEVVEKVYNDRYK